MLEIKILGIPKSREVLRLMARVRIALEHLELECDIEVEGDLQKLMAYNLSGIPALVIGDDIVFQKEIPELDSIIEKIEEHRNLIE